MKLAVHPNLSDQVFNCPIEQASPRNAKLYPIQCQAPNRNLWERSPTRNECVYRKVVMAKCDEGYLCEVCGKEVASIHQSDLYLRYIIGEIGSRQLLSAPERHLRCNPTLAQFIVNEDFAPVVVDGPFSKNELDPADVASREKLVTRGWKRLQEVRTLGIPISDYPLEEFQKQK